MPPLIAEAPSNGVHFNGHISCGDSSVDRLWEAGGGFSSFGEYIRTAAIVQASQKGYMTPSRSEAEKYEAWSFASTVYRRWEADRVHPAVKRAISTPDGMFELSDPDGGAVIPPQFIKEVWDKARFRDTPMSRARTIVVTSNAGFMPAIDETSRVDGSRWGGLTSYWEAEVQQFSKVFPTLMNEQYRLKKLTALVPATEELFEDSALLDGFITETVNKELTFKTNDAMINGVGAGQLLGVVNGPGTIAITKDTSQASKTISATNVSNMWIRMHGPSRANAVWYANEEFDPDNLALPVTPMTGWQGEQPAPTLKGRYCHPLENCQAIGTPGDLILGDWSQYLLLMGGMRKHVSMHFKFDYHEAYFRFSWRCSGQPLWMAPLTSIYGTVTKSPFVVIQAR